MARRPGQARPERVSDIRRAVDSWSATVLIVLFVAGPFVLAILWRDEVSVPLPTPSVATAVDRGLAVESGASVPLKALLLFPWAALAMMVLARVVRPGVLRHRPWVPFALESVGRQVVDQSMFGAGSLARWTKSNPDVGIDRLVKPPSLDKVHRLFEIADGDRSTVAGSSSPNGAMRVVPGRVGADLAVEDRWSGAVRDHVVGRGDTWWALAEGLLGDGDRWKVVRDLNVGREVAVGVVLGVDDELGRGWRIVVPVSGEGEER